MKRILMLLGLLSLPLSAQAAHGVAVGYQVGTESAVAIGVGRWDLSVGTERFVVNVDRRFHTKEFPALYFGLGGQVSEDSNAPVGLRTKVGLSARADMVELFGEVVPNVTFGDAGDVDVDYALGLRIWF
ncbi:hypothetical protein Fbal_3353 [Ferrimonas balearica DSM 9799]|uniref:Outer membrane protein beta-barrel domain-containing protein n=1 Tax=Ferrimonas balearica (strain DSM 9799 / CCM 4581 / KCTC 23876 / PAT) TaxID=550540 RepID=E1SLK0_FERBD|nr:hypothetical protein [Ferrimonas balearica]MBY6019011.1 hypothetical protein [Halomonas denitrificans]ADN77551.1 hypothetical protein Fbal_3353 [Ferrimonas balearica DSM 9799]MBY5981624.1 hypothetical protein [Ferrimonas balearica]MBY6095613.1 hypothetical protein [Ferrimonas balearica]MBY6225232.1 hypothetical protein [Ferrimonas balearica]